MIICTKARQCRLGLELGNCCKDGSRVSVSMIHRNKSAEISENRNKYVSEYVPPEQIRGPEQICCDTGRMYIYVHKIRIMYVECVHVVKSESQS